MSLELESQVLARVRAIGIPKPAGSKVPFVNKATGHAGLKEMTETPHTEWRNVVTSAAYDVAQTLPAPLDGALGLEVTFRFEMPASAKAAIRRIGHAHKITAPDTDKLVRSICDSLQAAALIKNDARFATVFAAKIEVLDQWTGAEITIRRLA